MNKQRRAEIAKITTALNDARVALENWRDEIDTLKSEEEEYRDAMPENMQSGERYTTADAACDALQEAYDAVDEAVSALDNAANSLDTASE